MFAGLTSFCWFCRVAAQIVCEMSFHVLVRLCAFSTRDIWWPVGGSMLGVRAAKGLSRQFQADLVTKQGEIVTEQHCC